MIDQLQGNRPKNHMLNMLTDLLLALAGFGVGWLSTYVVSTHGPIMWFAILACASFMVGIACHQLFTRGRWRLTLFCLITFTAGTGIAYLKGLSQPEHFILRAKKPALVKAKLIPPQSFTEHLKLSGTVAPNKSAVLSFAGAGRIVNLNVDENDRVKKGQVLATIDDSLLQANLAEAKAASTRAKADQKRLENLFKEDSTSEELLDNSIANNDMAEAHVKAINAKINDTILKAPFDGRIASRTAETGEYASPGKPVFELVSLNPVKVFTGVPEVMINKIHKKSDVTLTVDAIGNNKLFKGKVSRIALKTSPGTPIYNVEITIPNPDEILKPGLFARLSIDVKKYPKATILEIPWVYCRNGEYYIFQLRSLDQVKQKFLDANPKLGEKGIKAIVNLIENPRDFWIAKKIVLKRFIVYGDKYIILDELGKYPIVIRGGHALHDLTPVRTGILKESAEFLSTVRGSAKINSHFGTRPLSRGHKQ